MEMQIRALRTETGWKCCNPLRKQLSPTEYTQFLVQVLLKKVLRSLSS